MENLYGEYTQIAIDGTMASGKGTIAKGLADKLGYEYLDTGVLYRKLGLFSLILDKPSDIIDCLKSIDIEGIEGDVRSLEAGQSASKVAILPKVQEFATIYSQN